MRVLLISNDYNIINKFEDELHVINSIILAPNIANNFDYLIIDEKNLMIENDVLDILSHYKDKIILLGYGKYPDYITIQNEEFNLDNIESYFKEKSSDTENYFINSEDQENDIALLNFMDKFAEYNIPIDETLAQLDNYDLKFKNRLYSYLPHSSKIRILKEANIKNKIRNLKYIIINMKKLPG